jgi:hypothetical protein
LLYCHDEIKTTIESIVGAQQPQLVDSDKAQLFYEQQRAKVMESIAQHHCAACDVTNNADSANSIPQHAENIERCRCGSVCPWCGGAWDFSRQVQRRTIEVYTTSGTTTVVISDIECSACRRILSFDGEDFGLYIHARLGVALDHSVVKLFLRLWAERKSITFSSFHNILVQTYEDRAMTMLSRSVFSQMLMGILLASRLDEHEKFSCPTCGNFDTAPIMVCDGCTVAPPLVYAKEAFKRVQLPPWSPPHPSPLTLSPIQALDMKWCKFVPDDDTRLGLRSILAMMKKGDAVMESDANAILEKLRHRHGFLVSLLGFIASTADPVAKKLHKAASVLAWDLTSNSPCASLLFGGTTMMQCCCCSAWY